MTSSGKPTAHSRLPATRETSVSPASADSSGILCKRLLRFTVVVLMDSLFDLFGAQLPIRLDDRPLAVQPLGLDRVQPGRLDRQGADPNLAAALALHLPVVRPDPAPDPLADVPQGFRK